MKERKKKQAATTQMMSKRTKMQTQSTEEEQKKKDFHSRVVDKFRHANYWQPFSSMLLSSSSTNLLVKRKMAIRNKSIPCSNFSISGEKKIQ